jgi:hypothetical protein
MTTLLSALQPPVDLELRDTWVQRGHRYFLSAWPMTGLGPPNGW